MTSKRRFCAETDQNFARIKLMISFFNQKVKQKDSMVDTWKIFQKEQKKQKIIKTTKSPEHQEQIQQ